MSYSLNCSPLQVLDMRAVLEIVTYLEKTVITKEALEVCTLVSAKKEYSNI